MGNVSLPSNDTEKLAFFNVTSNISVYCTAEFENGLGNGSQLINIQVCDPGKMKLE